MKTNEMSLAGHFEELRKRVIITLGYFVIAVCAAFLFVKPLYRWLVRDVDSKLVILGPTDVVWIYLMLAGAAALVLTVPVAGYQLWRYVAPALSAKEQTVTFRYIPALTLLFLLGILFGYYVLFPMVLRFLDGMAGDFETMYTADKYFRFLLNMTVPLGFLFEMPVAVMFLTRIGILNPDRLAKSRKISYFALVVLAVTITPPDIVSDLLVTLPLLLLFELSVTLSRMIYQYRREDALFKHRRC